MFRITSARLLATTATASALLDLPRSHDMARGRSLPPNRALRTAEVGAIARRPGRHRRAIALAGWRGCRGSSLPGPGDTAADARACGSTRRVREAVLGAVA